MKRRLLLLAMSVFAFLATASAETGYNFPASEIVPLWGHGPDGTKTVSVDIEPDGTALVTFEPTGGFWEAQAGWSFARDYEGTGVWEGTPKDFTGYISLVCEFETIGVTDGNVIIGVVSTEKNSAGRDFVEVGVNFAETTATVDISELTAEQLASICHISFQITDPSDATAQLWIKNAYLVAGEVEPGDFPLSKMIALYGHSTVNIDYEYGVDSYATVTLDPSDFWAAQAGWNFETNPKDFTGNISLVVEFEDVEFNSGNILLSATSGIATTNTEGNDVFAYETSNLDWTAYSITLDLSQFTAEQLADMRIVSIMVTDDPTETAVLKIKKVYLDNGQSSVKYTAVDDNALVDVYTITGIRLFTQINKADAMNQLPNGLYIIGNKKVFIAK